MERILQGICSILDIYIYLTLALTFLNSFMVGVPMVQL